MFQVKFNGPFESIKDITHYEKEGIFITKNDISQMIIEVDIVSAGPSIFIEHYSNKYPELTEKIRQTDNKKQKYILISTYAKEILNELVEYMKYYLFSFLQKYFIVLDIITYTKDGGIFIVVNHQNSLTDTIITNHFLNQNIQIRIRPIIQFIQTSKYQIIKYFNNRYKTKKHYKKIPYSLLDFLENKLSYKDIYHKYSRLFYEKLLLDHDVEYIKKYLQCRFYDYDEISNDIFILTNDKKYINITNAININGYRTINPEIYLEIFFEELVYLV